MPLCVYEAEPLAMTCRFKWDHVQLTELFAYIVKYDVTVQCDVYIADQYAPVRRTRYWNTISVRLSVRHVLLLCLNECTYPQLFRLSDGRGIIRVFEPNRRYKIPTGTLSKAKKGKVHHTLQESVGGYSSSSSRPWARRWRTTNVCDVWLVQRQTYG